MNRAPRLTPGCDIKSYPLTPGDAFLLSRVDGVLTAHDLAIVTGLSREDVGVALERLRKLGAIELPTDASPPPVAPPAGDGPRKPSGTTPAAEARSRTPAPPAAPAVSTFDGPPRYAQAELDEEVEIERDRRRRILDLYYRLDEIDYYALLGVHQLVDKKEIKRAYYAVAPEFHPDRFFRKSIGSYKAKIEAIFSHLTLAHDVLTSRDRRAEYDEYLAVSLANRAMVEVLERTESDIASAVHEVEEAAAAFRVPPPLPAAPPVTAESIQARRETLARKLFGGGPRPATGSAQHLTPSPVPPPTFTASQRGEALRTRYEAARFESLRRQIERYVSAAKAALLAGEYAAAANAYRIAASLAPDDEAVLKACHETARLAATKLADGFLKQAELESRQNRWAEAALSYAKACEGRPEDAPAHDRAAIATIRSGGNARRAVEYARRAVELAPKSPDYHVTLARAYFAAGLEKSGEGEIERAIQLAPNDARIRELIARARESVHKDAKPS